MFKIKFVLFPLTKLKVTFVGSTKVEFKTSFVKTFNTAVPPVNPLIPDTLSAFASIGDGKTLTITNAVSQFVGFRFSQI